MIHCPSPDHDIIYTEGGSCWRCDLNSKQATSTEPAESTEPEKKPVEKTKRVKTAEV